MARQRLGQHFLADLDWQEQISRAIRVSRHAAAPIIGKNYCWIEIGAGHGEMTEHLAASGAPVYAIEIDARLGDHLRHLSKQFCNITVIQSDMLEVDIASIAAGRRVRVYGNLPYYITSPILHRLFSFAGLIDEIDIVIQTEVALRLAAKPGSKAYGYLSVVTQLYSRPEFVFEIPRSAFSPPPEVTSALVTLRFPGERTTLALPNVETFLDFVKICFAQKRKNLVNNLRALAEPQTVRNALESLGLRPDARAEQLSVAEFSDLFRSLLHGPKLRDSCVRPPGGRDSRS